MPRYMIHLRNSHSFTPKDAAALLRRARSLIESGGVVLRDTRVSSNYIEFDASLTDESSLSDVLERLQGIAPLASYEPVVERHMPKVESINRAVQYFNDEKYWGAHEILEGVWKSTSGTERSILNGIILVAAAFVHDEKDEREICISILRRALNKLEGASGVYRGIDIDRLTARVMEIVDSGRIERFAI